MTEKITSLPSPEGHQYQKMFDDLVQMIQQGQRRVSTEINFALLFFPQKIRRRFLGRCLHLRSELEGEGEFLLGHLN